MENKTILVIEDNEINLKLVRSLLKIEQYHVLEACDAYTGIELAREQKPDLILMDIQLPGMDGFIATKKIKKDPDLRHIPVIALTALAMPGDEKKAHNAGCDGYICKPIHTRSFLAKVSQILEGGIQSRNFPEEKNSRFKNRILIVDDDPLHIQLLTSKIPSAKYEIRTAPSGKEALKAIAEKIPDLILLDIVMPDLDGFDVMRILKNDPKTSAIPIILITALNGARDKIKGLAIGADEFINKPVTACELLARIDSLLMKKKYKEQWTIRKQTEESLADAVNSKVSIEEIEDLPTILLVGNDVKNATLIKTFLHAQPFQLHLADTVEEAISIAKRKRVDLILLDILPVDEGLKTCKRFKEMEQTRNLQIMVISSFQELANKNKCNELCADDYLIQPIDRQELITRINTLLEKKACMDNLRLDYEHSIPSTITDNITGMYNQRFFNRFLDLEIKQALRYDYPIALIMIAIDNLGQCKDTHGDSTVNTFLKKSARIIKNELRETDLIARYENEMFAVILPYVDSKRAELIASRLSHALAKNTFSDNSDQSAKHAALRMGIALCPLDASTAKELIWQAEFRFNKSEKKAKDPC